MTAEIPTNNPEKKEVLDDNARKFIVGDIAPEFLKGSRASSFTLITDWLETASDNEKKLAYKEFESGDIQILLIAKVTKDGSRTAEKQRISHEEYEQLLADSILSIEKERYEFNYEQGGTLFTAKYDEFAGNPLRVLEVDALTENERTAFDPNDFPYKLTEVTGDLNYYGYRVAKIL